MSTVSYRFVMSFDVVGDGSPEAQAALIINHMNETVLALQQGGNVEGEINENEEVIGYWRMTIVQSLMEEMTEEGLAP